MTVDANIIASTVDLRLSEDRHALREEQREQAVIDKAGDIGLEELRAGDSSMFMAIVHTASDDIIWLLRLDMQNARLTLAEAVKHPNALSTLKSIYKIRDEVDDDSRFTGLILSIKK